MKYLPYPKYKDSGIEWLGEVPSGWKVKSLRYIGKTIIGLTYNPSDIVEEREGTLVLRSSNIQNSKLCLDDNVYVKTDIPRELITCVGDILICSRNGSRSLIGKNIKIGSDTAGGTFGTFMTVFRSQYCDYLYHVFNSSLFQFQSGAYLTSTINQLTVNDLKSFKIPLPSLPEQISIVSFLDHETGRIDTLLAKNHELIERLKEQRIALITRTVTRGLPAEVSLSFDIEPHTILKHSGIGWLGEIPELWEALPLRRVVISIKTGGTPSGLDEQHLEEGGFNWYSPSDFSDGIYLGKSNRTLSDLGKEEIRIFQPMTVMLVGIGATIGKVGLSLNRSSCNQQINGIVCGQRLNPVYCTYYLKTIRDLIVKCGKFTTLPIINQDETKNLIITLPPIKEQIAIANYLNRETAKVDKLVEKVEEAINRLQEYRTALITAAVTGKIDVREKSK